MWTEAMERGPQSKNVRAVLRLLISVSSEMGATACLATAGWSDVFARHAARGRSTCLVQAAHMTLAQWRVVSPVFKTQKYYMISYKRRP